MRRIRLAIVDDSAFIRKAIKRVMEDEQRIQIVGTASSGEELIHNLDQWIPDVVTLDLSMPGMGGLLTLDLIMAWKPIPVVILSTHSTKDAPLTIEALHRGAVDFIDKQQCSLVDFGTLRIVLIEKILQVASGIIQTATCKGCFEVASKKAEPLPLEGAAKRSFEAILIGASTGGPPAIQSILEDIERPLPLPVAIVQHMPPGFTKAFADRLNTHLTIPVKEAYHGHSFLPGTAYIAPIGTHLILKQKNGNVYTALTKYPENVPHRPSVDILFKSAVSIYGKKILAVLLTGMGKDGAAGMAELASAGAYTIAQDESSCVVYGMPKAAVDLGAVQEVLSIGKIGKRLVELLNNETVRDD